MSVVPEVQIKVGNCEIDEVIQVVLHQECMKQHILTVQVRRDHLEKETESLFKTTQKFLGEKLQMRIKSDYNEIAHFKGIVTEIKTTRTEENPGDLIEIYASSPDILLADKSDYNTYIDQSLSEIVLSVLNNYGLGVPAEVSPRPNTDIEYVTQYDESAYDFLSRLAVRYGQWFFYDGTSVYFGALPQKINKLVYGRDLFNMRLTMKLTSFLYDYFLCDYRANTQHKVSSEATECRIPKLSDSPYESSKQLFQHRSSHFFQGKLNLAGVYDDLQKTVKLSKAASVSNLLVCNAQTDNPNLSLGSVVEITEKMHAQDKEKQLNHGKFIVIGLEHRLDKNGNYFNEFVAIPFDIEAPPYTNPDLFVIAEPHYATVKDNADPNGMGRIKVCFPWQETQDENIETPWLRIANPYAGQEKGFFFIPEVGEEVLVGFESGNVDKPYVLGGMYHGHHKTPEGWRSDKNDIKAIRTRSGHTVEFVDKEGGEEVRIYDGEEGNHQYAITLASHDGSVTLEARGDMVIKAENIRISANQNIELEASDISQKANQSFGLIAATKMSLDGGAQMEQKASASFSVDGGGQLRQKASIIKIN